MYIKLIRSGIAAVVALISLNLVSSVRAQAPNTFVNLGTVDFNATVATPNTITALTGDFNAGEIKWFQFTLTSPILTSGSRFLDIYTTQDTTSSEDVPNTDTEIGLYDSSGNLIPNFVPDDGEGTGAPDGDDDDGAGLFSQLTYGLNTEPRVYTNQQPLGTNAPEPFNGRDLASAPGGMLPVGTYWIAVGRFDVTFNPTSWGVSSDDISTLNNRVMLALGSGVTTAPEPGTISLFVLGGVGFLTRRKRKSA
jgi:hypothetical protein